MNRGLLTAWRLFADDAPRNTGPDFGKASPLGLLVIVLLMLGTVVLIRSMNRHLRKVPASFEEKNAPDRPVTERTAAAADTRPPGEAAGPAADRPADTATDTRGGSARTESSGSPHEPNGEH
ncbi:hypothetical protein [Mycobacterium botniense]|uniref:Uncharacterized protein n=1 Tax=Mycobacterium botniense TaxID=84962 RepID=A0A7I9XYW3_9MYCO|nr:hypothetical protein [Mycobacterium botniense]GFG74930.1 hypothetical protein MBOT_22950 [Mycobacterium botniense]